MISSPKIPRKIKVYYIPIEAKKTFNQENGGIYETEYIEKHENRFLGVVLPEKKERVQGESGTHISIELKLYIDNGLNFKIGDRIRPLKSSVVYEITSEDEYQYTVPNFRRYSVVKKELKDDRD